MKKVIPLFVLFLSTALFSQTEIKLNAVTLPALIPNIGIELQIGDKSSFQLDVLGSFWDSIDGSPFHVVQVFPEYRHYFKPNMRGFFIGGHVGFGMFTLTKYGYPNTIYQSGQNIYLGATIGYKIELSDRWALEVFLGGGSSQARYRAYDNVTGERVDVTPEDNNRPFNKSGEWIPYRGGIMLVYKLPSFRPTKK
ncbi:DUF3575 domain-containing protein [Tenacibaculum sp. SG-28]|uniref:DUF3575 domain-containing protein n=1 Tax=Tenacibaculum sp. SG-28 TaxID=754426 RepID=UPI000CF519E2|nr:DUF3575 domain-containing protein [Tenacibaculum sp. SG-28]PQJ21229.1 hypothetical protein BSU00_09655 [Tenacibaculum sp. SG-28]